MSIKRVDEPWGWAAVVLIMAVNIAILLHGGFKR